MVWGWWLGGKPYGSYLLLQGNPRFQTAKSNIPWKTHHHLQIISPWVFHIYFWCFTLGVGRKTGKTWLLRSQNPTNITWFTLFYWILLIYCQEFLGQTARESPRDLKYMHIMFTSIHMMSGHIIYLYIYIYIYIFAYIYSVYIYMYMLICISVSVL